jgi:hypothetical protein
MTAAALPQSPEPYEVPEGGLASFLTATVGDWSDEALNSDNYYDIVKPTAEQLAAFGREEDDRIAHVATGETVIPMAVFEEDPALKEALFARMRDMGIEPERYVVGNELNSINPVTGQPEFFLSKIFKGIKKAVKGVVKVFKKIAPIVLSIGLAMTPLGPIAGAALGSGLGTLIQGGDLKDAFKSALIGGAMGGLSSGIGSVMKGGEFMAGVKSGLPTTFGGGVNPTLPSVEELASKVTEATPVVDKTLAEQVVSEAAAVPPAAPTGAPGGVTLRQASAPAPAGGPRILSDIGGEGFKDITPAAPTPTPSPTDVLQEIAPTPTTGTPIAGVQDITAAVRQAADPGFFASMKEFFTTGNLDALKQAFLPGTKPEVILQRLREAGFNVSESVAADIAAELAPKTLRSYGPLAAAGLGIMGLTGGFEQPKMEPIEGLFGDRLPPYPFVQPGSNYQPLAAAKGGEIEYFPRKNGPIYGPGTETSDDIPAMLSDGEFVMTAKAVRGAGNGSREAGMRRMYDMMRKFEGGAARGN